MAIAEIAKDSQTTTSWVSALETWESVPAQSPMWDDVEEFIEALRKVTGAKLTERDAGREALRQALGELCDDFAGELEYFEARCSIWQAEAISRDEAQNVAARVSDLHTEMRTRKTLQEKPSAHYAEARRLREEISAVEETIFDHLGSLSALFDADTDKAIREELNSLTLKSVNSEVAVVRDEMPAATPSSVVEEIELPGGDRHARVDVGHGGYSPLTRSQERSVLSDAGGVGLIFASGALGFEHLPEAVAHLATTGDAGRAAYGAIPPSVAAEQGVYDWIAAFAADHSGAERLLICQPVAVPSADIVNRFNGALRYCDEHANAPVRVLFFLAPGAVGAWLTLPEETWNALEGRLKPVFSLKPWTNGAVKDRLESQGKLYDDETCRMAMEATGGWSWCLDKLFEMCGNSHDPKPAAEKISQELFPDLGGTGDLRDELLMRIGVRPETLPHEVLQLIHKEGEVPADTIVPEALQMEATVAECRAAVEFLQSLSCTEGDNGVIRVSPFIGRVLGTK